MRLHHLLFGLATALVFSLPTQASAQVDYATRYCYVWVEGHEFYTGYRDLHNPPIEGCKTYVQGLVDMYCPQLGTTNVFTMWQWATAINARFPADQWHWGTSYQCVNGSAVWHGQTEVWKVLP